MLIFVYSIDMLWFLAITMLKSMVGLVLWPIQTIFLMISVVVFAIIFDDEENEVIYERVSDALNKAEKLMKGE